MYPVLFSFGSFTIYTYGLFVALGFIFAVLYISNMLKKANAKILSQENFYSLSLYLILSAIIGARFLYVIVNFNEFSSFPLAVFKVWEGGLVYYGGFILAVLFFIFYTIKNKIPVLKLSDIMAPAIALGHFFGRLGCFFAGCCYGKVCDLPWGIVFNNPDTLAIKGAHLHPTQLYESFANLILFVGLHVFNKKQHKDGLTLAFYLIGYAVIRFTIEFFRGDFRGNYIFGLSVSQVVSVVIFIAGILIVYKVNKNARKS